MGRPQIILLAMIGLLIAALAGMMLYRPSQQGPAYQAQIASTGTAPVPVLPAPEGLTLADTLWTLSVMEGFVPPEKAGDVAPNFTLRSNSRDFFGFTGCNRMNGMYSSDASHLRFAPNIATTRMACPDSQDTEANFLAMLRRVDSWSMDGTTLVLADRTNATIARFIPSAPAAEAVDAAAPAPAPESPAP